LVFKELPSDEFYKHQSNTFNYVHRTKVTHSATKVVFKELPTDEFYNNPVESDIFFYPFTLVMTFVVLNVSIGIIMTAYSKVRYNTLQRTATHCNTLQHTATHCNTL